MTSAGARLRLLMRDGVLAPGAMDPFTARLIERAGFDALYLGGNALGLSLAKGQPLLTLTETAEAAGRIVTTSALPLIVDAGAGFGGPPHVHRSVIELERTGAAALHIDDQPYPKRPGYHRGSGGLAQLHESVARLRVAVMARRDPQFVVIARTDALRVTGSLDEAVSRGKAYLEAGADALMILDLAPDQVSAVRQHLPDAPLIWIGGVVPPVPASASILSAGFALALYPFNTIAAIAQSVTALWSHLKETGEILQPDALLVQMRSELAHIAGMQTYWQIEDELLAQQGGV